MTYGGNSGYSGDAWSVTKSETEAESGDSNPRRRLGEAGGGNGDRAAAIRYPWYVS